MNTRRKTDKWLPVDWKKIKLLTMERGWKNTDLSKMLGMEENYITNTIRVGRKEQPEKRVKQMALIFGCKVDDILKVDEEEVKKVDEIADFDDIEPSEFEKNVMEYLKDIKRQLATQNEILMFLFNEKQQTENKKAADEIFESSEKKEPISEKDELETSCDVLKELLENRGGVKKEDYFRVAEEKGVKDKKIADSAIAKLGLHKKTTGYGNNKTEWIYKEVQLETVNN